VTYVACHSPASPAELIAMTTQKPDNDVRMSDQKPACGSTAAIKQRGDIRQPESGDLLECQQLLYVAATRPSQALMLIT
jgi:hypothetical protein